MKASTVILACAALLLAAGCGLKAPPVARDTIMPRRIVDLQAVPREGNLDLVWTVPKENTDKTPLTDLEKFQILRSEGALIADECRGCGEESKVISEMSVGSPEEARGKRVTFLVENQEARKVYVYQVVSVSQKGYRGAPSNPVTVYWDYPPSTPSRVRADRGDRSVSFSWEPVVGATGYNVYRRGEQEKDFPFNPLNRTPLTDTTYTDLGVENEKTYVYSIRAVKRIVKTDVEGKGSLGAPVTPTDLIPPEAPTDLSAVSLREGIELNWRKNREPDLLGYNVYRRKIGEEMYKKLNETPLTKELYLDREVELDQEYEYAVTAVDNSARRNESPYSEEIRMKYLH
jgi:fibronectin type 3 domain-containing protein